MNGVNIRGASMSPERQSDIDGIIKPLTQILVMADHVNVMTLNAGTIRTIVISYAFDDEQTTKETT